MYRIEEHTETVAEKAAVAYKVTGQFMNIEEKADPRPSVPHMLYNSRKHGINVATDNYIIIPQTRGFIWSFDGHNTLISTKRTSQFLKTFDDMQYTLRQYTNKHTEMSAYEDFLNNQIQKLHFYDYDEEAEMVEDQIYQFYSSSMYSEEDVASTLELAQELT